jgi:hypothetical protein
MHISGYSVPATTLLLKSAALTVSSGRQIVASYLEDAQTHPELHPDALLTAHGPELPSTGTQGGIQLAMLRRLERGMDGEFLPQEENEAVLDAAGGDAGGGAEAGGEEGEAWQDGEAYALEQEVEFGTLEQGVEARNLESVPEVRVGEEGAVPETVKRGKTEVEKRKRKADKKERENLEKKAREKKRQQKS